jgi:uncharacterized membrane protein
MRSYGVIWLVATALALVGALGVVAFGSFLLRRVVEDMSNSLSPSAYVLRAFRVGPGLALIAFGGFLLFAIVNRILALPFPS